MEVKESRVLGNRKEAEEEPQKGGPAVVAGVWVYGAELPSNGLRLDSPGWKAWLEEATTHSFSYPLFDRRCGYSIGFMTVRKERRQRGGTYWTAYRRQGRRLRKIYLGTSSAITQARLEAVAARLLAELI